MNCYVLTLAWTLKDRVRRQNDALAELILKRREVNQAKEDETARKK